MHSHGVSTELDILYSRLQEKGQVPLSAICQKFRINKEKALEWSRILESGGLAVIVYPYFREPILMLNKHEQKEQNEKE